MRVFSLPLARWAAAFLLALVPACYTGAARSQEGSGERTVSVSGVERSYVVHLPSGTGRPAPVVFVFHGGGGRPEGIEQNTGMDQVADQNGFIAVYPAGDLRASGRGGSWNVGGSISPSSSNDVAFVRAIVADLERNVPVDRARIYATGLSMGGVFAYRLACEMSDTFAAIAPVAATMVERSCAPHSPVAVLHIHGAEDDRIPIAGGRGELTAANRSWPAPQAGLSFWSRFDQCVGQPARSDDGPESCTTYGQCRATVEYCVINGGGHAWPGGASEQIWAFFAAHSKQ